MALRGQDDCVVSERWRISWALAHDLIQMADSLEFGVAIISGYRSPEEQEALRRAGRPTASIATSTHLSCPATGADVMPQIFVTDVVKARLGAQGVFAGLRWGGGSPVDPDTGIPSDWNHFDLGPRPT